MKKVLVVSDSLRIGGIQKSLKLFLKELSKEKIDLTLFLFNDSGKEELSDLNINIISGTKLLKLISYTSEEAKEKGIIVYVLRKFLALLCKLFTSDLVYSFIFLFEKRLNNYDSAISYSNNVSNRSVYFGYNKFVIEKVKSKNKITYLHVDYNNIYTKKINKEYQSFDNIWCVSNYVKSTFLKYNKHLKNRIKVVYNFIDDNKDIKGNPFGNKKHHIITVGRLDKNKSQIESIYISKKLKDKNVDFEWYLIGDGPEKNNIIQEIKSNNLENNIFLIGNKNNINDYLNYSDIFVSLSKSESYGLAIAEALKFNTITIVKDIPVIKEIIDKNGIICKNNDIIVDEIYKLLNNKKYYLEKKKLSKLNIKNDDILKEVLRLLKVGDK